MFHDVSDFIVKFELLIQFLILYVRWSESEGKKKRKKMATSNTALSF